MAAGSEKLQLFQISENSPAAASTVAGSTIASLGEFDDLRINAELVGATGGTLDVYLQMYDGKRDGTGTWYDFAHFPQLAGGAAAIRYGFALARDYPASPGQPVVIGKDLTPALAANVIINGSWGDQMRAVYVAGVGTSAGAVVLIKVTGYRRRAI